MENMIDPLNKESKSRNLSQEKAADSRRGYDEGIGSVKSKDHQDFLQEEISKIMSDDEERIPKPAQTVGLQADLGKKGLSKNFKSNTLVGRGSKTEIQIENGGPTPGPDEETYPNPDVLNDEELE